MPKPKKSQLADKVRKALLDLEGLDIAGGPDLYGALKARLQKLDAASDAYVRALEQVEVCKESVRTMVALRLGVIGKAVRHAAKQGTPISVPAAEMTAEDLMGLRAALGAKDLRGDELASALIDADFLLEVDEDELKSAQAGLEKADAGLTAAHHTLFDGLSQAEQLLETSRTPLSRRSP